MNTDPFAFDHFLPPAGWAGTDAKQHTHCGEARQPGRTLRRAVMGIVVPEKV